MINLWLLNQINFFIPGKILQILQYELNQITLCVSMIH